ncbi:hypothetical protein SPAB_03415 [Salmonella enterica subsp. enterica serovar Paratyphi B str. SPB7]|uniref:Uncharacterized protein n=1 Tax=Salmonella paratyphi B (strain ATCC BAA-1250 / SPB7) TaxID=1016998 RepID=A0A6C6Z4W1_SALPB|nr:hypothetical protein SPAB_03415 [Salmonella enterica subsp. enterica serovar Paratyphi B str. SPB7]
MHGFACVFSLRHARPAPVVARPETIFAPALKAAH